MTAKKSDTPRSALWLLRHTFPGDHGEALAGDLVERFRDGATRGWFWKQVLIASTMGTFIQVRRRWAVFCYAAAGFLAMRYAIAGPVSIPATRIYLHPIPISAWMHWSDLPWPLSQFVFELSTTALATLAALTVLAAGLLIQHSFRWTSLLRTWILNFGLIVIGHYSIDSFPWLLRPVPGEPYHKVLIIPELVQVLLLVSTFVVAAWLGSPPIEPIRNSNGSATER